MVKLVKVGLQLPQAAPTPEAVPNWFITGLVRVLFVSVCVAVRVTTVSLLLGNVMVVESVPAKVSELLTVKVLALASVRAPVVEVILNPLIEVAVVTPKAGVTRVGLIKVLFCKVSVPVSVAKVSVVAGTVTVPEAVPEACSMVVPEVEPASKSSPLVRVIVLFERFCVSVMPTIFDAGAEMPLSAKS